jgi:(p)ppGpp synthase/HD superfamily hydrolase
MNVWKQLDKAISIAVITHANQFDRGGKPYILHPLHLMNQLMFDPELAALAVLHDVIEDGELTLDFFTNEGFSPRVVTGLGLLTHDPADTYKQYIEKMVNNYDVIRVKRKDLTHNSCTTRLKGVRPKDLDRIEKYHRAYRFLGDAKKAFQK